MRLDRATLAAAMIRADVNGIVLSERSGLSRSTVQSVRSGKSCSMATVDKLAAVLGREAIDEAIKNAKGC